MVLLGERRKEKEKAFKPSHAKKKKPSHAPLFNREKQKTIKVDCSHYFKLNWKIKKTVSGEIA